MKVHSPGDPGGGRDAVEGISEDGQPFMREMGPYLVAKSLTDDRTYEATLPLKSLKFGLSKVYLARCLTRGLSVHPLGLKDAYRAAPGSQR